MDANKKYNEIAAKWWADKLREKLPQPELGNKSQKEAIDSFEKELAEAIKDGIEGTGELVLCVNYSLDFVLDYISYRTKLNRDLFPVNTGMCVRKDLITVIEGVGNAPKIIWKSK